MTVLDSLEHINPTQGKAYIYYFYKEGMHETTKQQDMLSCWTKELEYLVQVGYGDRCASSSDDAAGGLNFSIMAIHF